MCTWNLGGVKPYEQVELKEWLLPGISAPEECPAIFVIGMQQVVPLEGSMWKRNRDEVAFLKSNVMACLNKYASRAEYTLVRHIEEGGNCIFLIAKREV